MQLESVSRVKLSLFFAQIFCVSLYSFLFIVNPMSSVVIIYLKWFVIIQFALNYLSNIKVNKWAYNIYGVFLTLFFIFLVSRVFLDLIGQIDFSLTSFFSSYKFQDDVVINILILLLVSLISLNMGFLINSKKSKSYLDVKDSFTYNQSYVKLGRIFFYMGLGPTIYKIIIIVINVAKYGYLSIFLNPELFNIPIYISFFSMLFPFGFYFCHIGRMSNKKELKFITIIFILSVMLEILVGKRGTVLTQLLVLLWFYAYFYGNKLSFKKLSIIALLIIVSSQAALSLRSNQSKDIFGSVSTFLYQQGVSIQVIGYALHEDIESKYDFSPFDIFRPVIQSTDIFLHKLKGSTYSLSPEERMDKYNNYSMIIANSVDSNKFEAGFGIGGSYIAELYLIFGFSGLIIFNILLGYLLSRVEFILGGSFIKLIVALLILPDIVYLPRSYILEIFNTQLRSLILLYLIYICVPFLKRGVK